MASPTEDEVRFRALQSLLEEYAKNLDKVPRGQAMRRELEARIAPFNASLDYGRQAQKPLIVDKPLGRVAGWTNRKEPFQTYIQMLSLDAKNDPELADVVSHEIGHHERGLSEIRNRIGFPETQLASQLLARMQAQKTYPVSANAEDSTEEILASMKGIEGRLLKGTPITATKEFKDLTQEEKNFYFGETSGPSGGIWEGQIPLKERTMKDVMDEITGNAADKAKSVQDWLQQQIGKVIGTR